MRTQGLQGVNLGGWLIPEKWLTPSLFKGLQADDMYELALLLEGKQRLEEHFKEFITEADFVWLAEHKVQLVRIPVGYWLVDGDGPFASSVQYLDWAMQMAEKYNIKVLIDLHAAKGSQNGEMHSGKKGSVEWQDRPEYQRQTIDTLKRIAERYYDNPQFWGLELLNEPKLGHSYFMLLKFYRQAYKELKEVLRPGVYTIFHDAFHPLLFSGALPGSKTHPVALDVHWYALAPRLFGRCNIVTYLFFQRIWHGGLLRLLRLWQPVIVGEWSSVLPQAMFDRTPKKFHYDLLAANIAAQQKLYVGATAHVYWTYKADGTGMWNFRSLVDSGIITPDDYI